MKIEPMPEGTGALIARMAADDRKAASEIPTSEIAGPAKVVAAVATGSDPVLVGVLDMLEWKWRSIAAQHRNDARERSEDDHHVRLQVSAETLEACALELRLLTDDATGRQPESNVADDQRSAERTNSL